MIERYVLLLGSMRMVRWRNVLRILNGLGRVMDGWILL